VHSITTANHGDNHALSPSSIAGGAWARSGHVPWRNVIMIRLEMPLWTREALELRGSDPTKRWLGLLLLTTLGSRGHSGIVAIGNHSHQSGRAVIALAGHCFGASRGMLSRRFESVPW